MHREWRRSFEPSRRLEKTILGAMTLAILGFWVAGWVSTFMAWDTEGKRLGTDLHLYVNAALGWADTGSFYPERQLVGPYEIETVGEILYPPPSLLLFLPFSVLPAVLWWAIPLAVIAAVIAYWRPAPFGWPVLAFILWWPRTNQDLLTGNPAIWAAAAAALGTIWAWASVLVLIKPTLAPAAIFGIRRRGWWIGMAGVSAVSLLFLPLWPEYVKTLMFARHPHGWLYSFSELPMALTGVVAWATSTRRAGPSPSIPVGGWSRQDKS